MKNGFARQISNCLLSNELISLRVVSKSQFLSQSYFVSIEIQTLSLIVP